MVQTEVVDGVILIERTDNWMKRKSTVRKNRVAFKQLFVLFV